MQILQLLSLLLDYPKPELQSAQEELLTVVATSNLPERNKDSLFAFINQRCSGELMDWQSEYDSLFERGRSLSLLIFEHVHGESRDRGQAMVDLQAQYKEAGLDIGVKELPDYLPLYLEFLSTQGAENAQIGLEEIAPILAVLACRLEQRESNYAALFQAMLTISTAEVDLADIKAQIASEQRDDTPKALDKVWEEEMVTFMSAEQGNTSCGSNNKPSESQRRDHFVPLSTDLLNSNVSVDHLAEELFHEAAIKRA